VSDSEQRKLAAIMFTKKCCETELATFEKVGLVPARLVGAAAFPHYAFLPANRPAIKRATGRTVVMR
jgi:hypothetical protein